MAGSSGGRGSSQETRDGQPEKPGCWRVGGETQGPLARVTVQPCSSVWLCSTCFQLAAGARTGTGPRLLSGAQSLNRARGTCLGDRPGAPSDFLTRGILAPSRSSAQPVSGSEGFGLGLGLGPVPWSIWSYRVKDQILVC